MKLLHDRKALLASVKDLGHTMFVKDPSTDHLEVKEKRSSNASLLLMNPVASGDNVTTGLNSAHKLKEELPPLVPCCEGRELQITEDLARTGLSAISVKHDSVIQSLSLSRACEKLQVPPGLVKHRNSFRCLHRPDLKRVPYLRRMTSDELEMLFRGYADFPSRAASRSESQEETMRGVMHSDENIRIKDLRTKENFGPDDVSELHPIPEMRSGAEDLPAGMRLHGTRARIYTSVLAGAKAGDQLDFSVESVNEGICTHVSDDIVPDDEVLLNEELQIILPPRCDDITTESSATTTLTESSVTS